MLSNRLKIVRNKKKLTQEELAKLVKTTKGTISNYENGHSTPSNEMLKDLANVLDTTTDYLLGRTNNPNREVNSAFHNFDDLTEEERDYLDLQLEIFRKMKKKNK